MLMDQQNIICKQKETIEMKKHQLTKLKTYKNNRRTRKKTPETTKQTEETKKVSKSFALCAKTKHLIWTIQQTITDT